MSFTSMLGLLIATVFYTFFLAANVTRASLQDLSILTKTLASNSSSSLIFDDAESGEKTLAALSASQDIEEACLFKPDGQIFASYLKTASPQSTDLAGHISICASGQPHISTAGHRGSPEETSFFSRYFIVAEPLYMDEILIGTLWVKKNKSRLQKSITTFAVTSVFAFLCMLFLSFIFSTRFHSVISQPIVDLAKAMDKVSLEKDLKIRVQHESTDEIGTLIKGFNTMLEEIQTRDDKLLFTQYSIEKAGDAAYWMDNRGRFYYVNEAARRMLGISEEEFLNSTVEDIAPYFFSERWPAFWERLKKQKTLIRITELKHRDGEVFPVEIIANYVHYGDREYNCAMVRNISERKHMEERLRQAEKLKAVGTLAAGVAHDLNNILSGVVSYPELLLLKLPQDDPMAAPLEAIKKSGQRAAAIVMDMLSLTRRGAVILKTINLNRIIEEYLQSIEFLTLKKEYPDVVLHTELKPDLYTIKGSSVHLSKTFMNLLLNGLEAVGENGQIRICTYNHYLDQPISGYDAVEEGEYVVLSVEDNGTGISESDQDRIFEPFYTKKKLGRSGTGLGMTVVWATVQDHGGYIDFSSVIDKGTRFDLYFPISRATIDEDPAVSGHEHLTGHGTILVVDDVLEQRHIAGTMLQTLGYKVKTLESGEKAVEFIRDNHVDLIVLDMIMDPGINGLETYKRILEIRPGQKAIVASGFSENEDAKKVLQIGAGSFIIKPYTLKQLGSAVRAELDSDVKKEYKHHQKG